MKRIFVGLALGFLAGFPAHAALDCSRTAGMLPNPDAKPGTKNPEIPIEHVVVIMQENHSFDGYLGRLNDPKYYGSEIDGIIPELHSNPGRDGKPVSAFHETKYCAKDPGHSWNAMHQGWNGGLNDQFVKVSGKQTMGYYEDTELPYYYALANTFATSDRYFSSLLSQTFPNRFFLLTGTAFGHIANDIPFSPKDFSQKTIFDLLDDHGVSWKYYTDGLGYLQLFRPLMRRARAKIVRLWEYESDLKSGKLPQVSFVESNYEGNEDEHPKQDVRIGQAWVAKRVNALIASPAWKSSALFLTYDESGGFYDHVAPPEACIPDDIAPMLRPDSIKAKYDRLGFRVPFVAVSPYVKRHYVSHVTYDHTSILKFIETTFNLPALTRRDANADAMLDLFDFKNPVLSAPNLPAPQIVDPNAPCDPNNG